QEALESTEDVRAKSRLDEIRASMSQDKQLTSGDEKTSQSSGGNNDVVEPEVAGDSADNKASGDVHDAAIEQVLDEAKKAVDDKKYSTAQGTTVQGQCHVIRKAARASDELGSRCLCLVRSYCG